MLVTTQKGSKKYLTLQNQKRTDTSNLKIKKTLDNISFFDYKTKLIDKIQTEYNFDKAIEIIKKDKEFSIRLSDDKMKAFAHVLFNKGYLTGENNCWGGALEYVDRSKDDK